MARRISKIIALVLALFALKAHTQGCLSVDINDNVYNIIDSCVEKGLHPFVIGTRPYTQNKIVRILQDVLHNVEVGYQDDGSVTEEEVALLKKTSNIPEESSTTAEVEKENIEGESKEGEAENKEGTEEESKEGGAEDKENKSDKKSKKKKTKKPRPPRAVNYKMSESERQVIQYYIDKFSTSTERHHVGWVFTRLQNKSEKVPLSFEYNFTGEADISAGVYTKKDFNAVAFDLILVYDFAGDISKYFSYRLNGVFDLSRVPLYEEGKDYFVGYSWFDTFTSPNGTYNAGKTYDIGDYTDLIDSEGKEYADKYYGEPHRRILRKQTNTSYLPFTYLRRWGGQVYYLENLKASGLEGWPKTTAITFAITADIRTSFLNDKINIGIGRIRHNWASMDTDSSLILNSHALPFFSFDASFDILPCLKFSTLTGILEYPNQDYIAKDSWPDNKEDDSLFQNAFSINMLELDYRYFHFDFGSSVVWPKRFELGYMFPLINYVVYQNHLGDNDNCALFMDIKFRKEKIGSIWASIYLDEINGLNNNPFTSARAMYAGQLGVKAVIPRLPFTTISLRYTKVEPFCYTHHSINYTPWYDHYVSESYTSGGEALGYYLPPNADEVLLRFETTPLAGLTCSFQYQFIRHGADYGSQQVQGSSLYSELTSKNRDAVTKHFLHDGAYNWQHIITLGASYAKKNDKVPFNIFGNIGFIVSYYTMINSEDYEMGVLGNHKCDMNTKYFYVNTSEYPATFGAVFTVGIKLWKF